MVAVGTEGSDEVGGVVVEGIVPGDGKQEVLLDIFVLQTSDLFTMLVDDGVLVWVISNGGGAGQGGKEVWEELSFWGDGKGEIGKNGSGWGRRGDDSNWSFNNGQREVFNGDVSEGDSLNDFFKLEVDVGVLVFGGQGVLKLGAYNVSLLGSDVGEDVKEVGWCGNDGGWGRGAIGIEAHGGAITTWARIVSGVVRTIEIVLDDLVGSSDIDLISVVDLRPVSNREGRGDDKGG
jgi:hypothetical protein